MKKKRCFSADELVQAHQLNGAFAIVSPVHWEAGHNDAVITAIEEDLAVSESELQDKFVLLRDYVRTDGMDLIWHSSYLWLLRMDGKPAFKAKPVYQLIHRSLMPELKALDEGMFWQKFLTECQMLIASKPNNTLVNGVWIWGNEKRQSWLHRLWRKLIHAN